MERIFWGCLSDLLGIFYPPNRPGMIVTGNNVETQSLVLLPESKTTLAKYFCFHEVWEEIELSDGLPVMFFFLEMNPCLLILSLNWMAEFNFCCALSYVIKG